MKNLEPTGDTLYGNEPLTEAKKAKQAHKVAKEMTQPSGSGYHRKRGNSRQYNTRYGKPYYRSQYNNGSKGKYNKDYNKGTKYPNTDNSFRAKNE